MLIQCRFCRYQALKTDSTINACSSGRLCKDEYDKATKQTTTYCIKCKYNKFRENKKAIGCKNGENCKPKEDKQVKCDKCANDRYRMMDKTGSATGQDCWYEESERQELKNIKDAEESKEDFEFKIEPPKFTIAKINYTISAMVSEVNLWLTQGLRVKVDNCTYIGFTGFDIDVESHQLLFYSGKRNVITSISFPAESNLIFDFGRDKLEIKIEV